MMSVALPPAPLDVVQQNAVEDKALVPGAGAFEIAAHAALMKHKEKVVGKPKLGVQVRWRLPTQTTPPYALLHSPSIGFMTAACLILFGRLWPVGPSRPSPTRCW